MQKLLNIQAATFLSFRNLYNFSILHQQKVFQKWNILKGDSVIMVSGKDKGKKGVVMKVFRKYNQVLVKGINMKFKRVAATQDGEQGGIKQISKPVHISKVSLIDPEKGIKTKIINGYTEEGIKVRVSKLSNSLIDKPVVATFIQRNKNKVDGMKETSANKVVEVTYKGEDFALIKAQFDAWIKQKEEKEKHLVFPE